MTVRACAFIPLCLELQTEADLVATGVDVLAVEESGQRQLDSCRDTRVRKRGLSLVQIFRSYPEKGLTWFESLGVAQAHQAGVVHLGLDEEQTRRIGPTGLMSGGFQRGWFRFLHVKTYREGCVGINLVLGGDAEAGVAVSSSPRQVDSCLQLLVDLLVDGASELGAVVPERETQHLSRERGRSRNAGLRLSWVHRGLAPTDPSPSLRPTSRVNPITCV